MQLEDIWHIFQRSIFALPGRQHGKAPIFNPYYDEDPGVDRSGAVEIRRENLRRYLESYNKRPEILVIGEAPGWRGCRFSGVPFTSELQLVGGRLPFKGEQSSLASFPFKEATATVYWQTMRPFHPAHLAWNCLPFHPHQPGSPLSNRHLTLREIDEYLPVLIDLYGCLQPLQVIAVGKTAQTVLGRAGIPAHGVRHPSHGGASEFRQEIDLLRETFTHQANPGPRVRSRL
jgi:uracil-DNA glycosylase